jgi:hypothetical protein
MNYVINNTPILTNFLDNSNNNNVSHHLDNNIFPLTKYKNLTFKQVLVINDEKYFKYLLSNFKIFYEEIFDFYIYLKLNNKFVDQITKLLNIKILFDTETTGFANYDIVLQLAYVVFNDVEILKSYDQIVKIDPKVSIKNSHIHGITNKKCNTDGICINDMLNRFVKDVHFCNSLIGHNVGFDIRMMKNEFNRHKFDCSIFENKNIIDTMDLYGSRIKLGELHIRLFNEEMINAHNALFDVMATYKIYKKLIANK